MRRSLAAVAVGLICATGAYANIPERRADSEYAIPRDRYSHIQVVEWTPETIPGTSCVSTESSGGGVSTVCFPTPAAPKKALKPDCEPDAIMIHPKAQFYFGEKFSALDKNDDGRITENEFIAVGLASDTPNLDERIREIRVMFAELDRDADGLLFEDGWYEAETCEDES